MDPAAPASAAVDVLGPQYGAVSASVLEQCIVEQQYMRGAQLRTLMYNQVSESVRVCCDVALSGWEGLQDQR